MFYLKGSVIARNSTTLAEPQIYDKNEEKAILDTQSAKLWFLNLLSYMPTSHSKNSED